MKKFRWYTLCSLLVCMTLITVACSGQNTSTQSNSTNSDSTTGEAGKEYTFKFAHISHVENVWHKQALKFAEELERLSDGRMKVEFFPGGQLGNEADMVQQLELGSLDFAMITNAYLSTRADAFNAWGLPFLFNSLEEGTQVRDSEPSKQMLASLSEQGLIGMEYAFVGNRHILMKDTPVSTPEDIAGKKIRITAGPSIQDFWKTAGASPEALPLPEVYTSLQTGVIDGIDIDLGSIVEQKFYEVADHLTLTNHMTFAGLVVMSKNVYDSLPAEDQDIINEAMKLSGDWGAEEAIKGEEANLKALQEVGITITEFSGTNNFESVSKELYEKYSGNEITKEFIKLAN